MSDWTSVPLKKKPPSVETTESPKGSFASTMAADLLSTHHIRAEFYLHPGSKTFNPSRALQALFTALQQCYPDTLIINVANNQQFLKAKDIPMDPIKFEQQFIVRPHLGRSGGGKVHIHFRLPEDITIDVLKQNTSFLNYLKHNRVWLAHHQFQDMAIVTAGYIFMKSPSVTHFVDYVKALKLYIFRNGNPPEGPQHTPNINSTVAASAESVSSGPQTWASVHDVPHMELNRRSLTLTKPNASPDDKPLQVQVLELKTSQENVHVIREAILSAHLSERTHGIFIPTPFLKTSPSEVYTTALRHVNFLQNLRVIPVSGLHPSTFSMDISAPDEPHRTFFDFIYTTKANPTNNDSHPSYLFSSVESSQLTHRNGKWYFLPLMLTTSLPTYLLTI